MNNNLLRSSDRNCWILNVIYRNISLLKSNNLSLQWQRCNWILNKPSWTFTIVLVISLFIHLYEWIGTTMYVFKNMVIPTLLKSNPNFRDITWNVEENMILHEISWDHWQDAGIIGKVAGIIGKVAGIIGKIL